MRRSTTRRIASRVGATSAARAACRAGGRRCAGGSVPPSHVDAVLELVDLVVEGVDEVEEPYSAIGRRGGRPSGRLDVARCGHECLRRSRGRSGPHARASSARLAAARGSRRGRSPGSRRGPPRGTRRDEEDAEDVVAVALELGRGSSSCRALGSRRSSARSWMSRPSALRRFSCSGRGGRSSSGHPGRG